MDPELIDGKYKVVRKLGEGGMGAVYEARHTGTGRRVAVKVIAGDLVKSSAEIVARFQREARATGEIETQHIAHVFDTGKDPESGNPYMVMELLKGEDLHHLLARVGAIAPDVALRIVMQACTGLVKAHEAGVVHRDIKPANLFLAQRDGGEVVVKLLDFGIAKVGIDVRSSVGDKAAITKTGATLGSPLYMSPEQARGDKDVDHRTDVWSLGVVLYEALTGRAPHAEIDTFGGLILAICSKPPRLVQDLAPWVKPEIAAIVHRALALDPAERFETASTMLAAIRAQLPGGSALDEKMLSPVSGETRVHAEPKHAIESAQTLPATSERAAAAFAPTESGAAPLSKPQTTTAGFAQSHDDVALTRARKAARWPIAVGAVLVAVAGFGVWRSMQPASVTSSSSTNASAPPSATTTASTTTTPSAIATTSSTVTPSATASTSATTTASASASASAARSARPTALPRASVTPGQAKTPPPPGAIDHDFH